MHSLGGVGLRGSALKAGTETSSSNHNLTHAAAALLGDLFSAADVVKVGWSFAKSDLGQLRASGRGMFARNEPLMGSFVFVRSNFPHY